MRPDPGGKQPLFVVRLRALVLRPQVLLESERLGEVHDRRALLRPHLEPELREEGRAPRCDLVQVDEERDEPAGVGKAAGGGRPREAVGVRL